MLELVAMAAEDGWAFVRTQDGLCVARPPYQGWSKEMATEEMLEQAICQHGFREAGGQFPDWSALIRHLKEAQVATWQATGDDPFTGQEIEELVHELSAEELEREFLDRVEQELLPAARWEAAERLLTKLLGMRVVRQSDPLNDRTCALLRQCQERKKNSLGVARSGNMASFSHVS
ncbi:MAG: hypothetical protein H7836_08455 [Magnetococcus sp. YQC-3]